MIRSASAAPAGFQPGGTSSRVLSGRSTPATYDAAARSVEAVFAVGAPVRRYGYVETLSMEPEAIDLSRVAAGQCKLLDSHNQWSIGAILGRVEDARIENGQLVGRLVFADSEAGRAAEGMVASGDLTGISIGYGVTKWTNTSVEDDVETWRADQWTLYEVTLCSVPADPAAGIRSAVNTGQSAQTMETEDMTRSLAPAAEPAGTIPAASAAAINPPAQRAEPATQPAPAAQRVEPAVPAANAAVAVTEDTRVVALTATEVLNLQRMANPFGPPIREAVDEMIGRNLSGDAIRAEMLRRAGEAQEASRTIGGPSRIEIMRDEGDTLRRGIETAIILRAAPSSIRGDTAEARAQIEQARQFRGLSLIDMFRDYAERAQGVRLRGFSRMEMATLALGLPDFGLQQRAAMSTSDFPYLLANVASRRLRDAYGAVTQTWRPLGRQTSNPDFKEKAVVQLAGLPGLKLVKEGQEYTYAGMGDAQEKYALATYGRIVAITRQALINDDLSAFDRLPSMLGRAAAELENDVAWGIFINNPVMADTKALFHSDHNNLGTAGDVTETTVAELEQKMGEQKDASGKTPLNLRPAYLVVTPKRKVAGQKLLGAIQPNASSAFNPYVNAMQLIVEARLKPKTGNEPWFVVGDPSQFDTFEYAYLDGQEGLYTEQRMGFEVDGIEIKGRLDFAAKAIDYRNMAKNAGA